MKGKAGWIIAGVAAYLIWLVMLAPVAPLVTALESRGIRLIQPAGRIWAGQAAALQVQGLTFRHIRWDFEATRLLLGRMQFSVEFRDQDSAALGKAGLTLTGTPFLHGLSGQLAASQVAPLLPIPAGLEGRFILDELGLKLADGLPGSAEGLVLWQNAGLGQPVELDLGNIEAVLSDVDTGVRADLSGGSARLRLAGWAELMTSGDYRIQLDFTPGDQEVSGWLSAVGEPLGGGRYRFLYDDSL